jgi:hypothetical protein
MHHLCPAASPLRSPRGRGMSFDPHMGRDRYFAVLAREVGWLVDPATGRLSEEDSHSSYESGLGYEPHCTARCCV